MATSTVTSIGSSSSNASSLASSLAVTGLASGVNWSTVVQQLGQAERAPETQWRNQQSVIAAQNAAYSTINTNLTALQRDARNLMDASFFNSVVATSASPAVASASVVSGTPAGNYAFNITQLATAAQINGAANVSQVLDPGGDPSTVTVGTAGFSTPVTAGTFTVNGAQITLAKTDSLKQVFDNIALATGNKVTASYSAVTDKITLTSSDGSPIVLGSATDTSNFLQDAQLFNNNSGTVASTSALGHVNTSAALNAADLKTTITDGGSGKGAFTINESAAGVSAAYDPVNNKFVLVNKTTGDVGISLQDVTGNFLAATGLAGGTLSHGKNLLYNLNGSAQQVVSQSNTIGSASSGILGLSVTALTTGTTTVNVSSDTTTISNAIQKFVTDYNTAQSFITSQQAVTTAADGTVTPGTLTGDTNTNDIATRLRALATAVKAIAGTSGAVKQLSDLGFQTNGQDNTIALSNASTLTSLLTGNLNDVKALFSDSTNGLMAQLSSFIDNTIGENGSLTGRQSDLIKQSSGISTQIANLETKISNHMNQWNSAFQAMETAQARANQELTYLSQGVANGSL